MPTVRKQPSAGVPSKRAKKGANSYEMPAPVPLGTVLTDNRKAEWKVGPSIGTGGFGEIYCCCQVATGVPKRTDDYPHVVKIEPHGNGPLFVEMHFYVRIAKREEIEAYKQRRGLKHVGMPLFVASGSHELDKVRHRFLVMPRYGTDLKTLFEQHGRCFPLHTVYRVALQLLDVLEYIHGSTYVHADIKGGNILLNYGKGPKDHVYLVDFGLASHYDTEKEFKPDPKKMHNGTIEYTSRDAHAGVPTMRGDMEILGYNVIEWAGTVLPWQADGILATPAKVQEAKERQMKDVAGFLRCCFKKNPVPKPIQEYVRYVSGMRYNEKPNYATCRKIFETGIKELGKRNSGELEFSTIAAKSTDSSGAINKPLNRRRKIINCSPDTTTLSMTPQTRSPPSPLPGPSNHKVPKISKPKPMVKTKKVTLAESELLSQTPTVVSVSAKKSGTSRKKQVVNNSPDTTSIDIRQPTPPVRTSSRTRNDKPKVKKTYNFNIEFDVSIDANIVVTASRKKRPAAAKDTPDASVVADDAESSPTPPRRQRTRGSSVSPFFLATSSAVTTPNDTSYAMSSVVSFNGSDTQDIINPEDDTVPNSDPNTPEPRYNSSRSVFDRTPQSVRQLAKKIVPAPVSRAGEYKGRLAKK